jgi:hypothetical protein
MAALAAGIVLASALVAPLVGAATGARAAEPVVASRSARVVVDGVRLAVRSPALPDATFVASKPGASLQGAAAVSQLPYREFSVRAYAFGSAAPMEGIGVVKSQDLPEYRATGAGRLVRSLTVPALIFGHRVEGSVRVVDIGLGPRRQPTEVACWMANAGGQLWIVRAAEPLPANRRAAASFAAGTSVSAGNLVQPTSGPRSDLATLRDALPAEHHPVAVARRSLDPPPVPTPGWWSGICDDNNHPGSFPLSSGEDVAVSFFPGAWGELEWECVELSMRWLYLEYGVRPYAANGSGVVANYSRADGGDLEQIANDGSSVPLPGDVLSMEPTSTEGHTAVVTATKVTHGNGSINILEQNMNGGNGTNTLSVVDNIVQPDYGMSVTEWLQSPSAVSTSAPNAPSAPSDERADLVSDGGFNHADGSGWRTARRSHFATVRAGRIATRPYEGNGFATTYTSAAGGGIYQDIPFPVTAGESFCADAEVVTAGERTKAEGDMTIWLRGTSPAQSSRVSFGPLPGGNRWTRRSTCITATRRHSDIRVQFYDDPKTPALAIDAVDVHQSLAANGGFNSADRGRWRTEAGSRLSIDPAGSSATRPYEGNRFAVTSTSVAGGGIYQDMPFPVAAGESFCADAAVVTAGARAGAGGNMTIWLRGTSASQSSKISFGPLPARRQWTPVSTCVTARSAHSDIRVQFYDHAGTAKLGIDGVDVHQSFVTNGGFNRAGGGWRAWLHTRFAIDRAGRLATRPYEGDGFAVTSTSARGGGIYQDISLRVAAGESFCADAEVITAAKRSGASGNMTLWLLGESSNQSSTIGFGPLPGKNRWTHISACVTATGPHAGIRIQFYDNPRTPPLGIDAVDVR